MTSMPSSAIQLTRILKEWTGGDESALARLTPIVYAELHRLARRNMAGEREGHMLQPSALVNEAFVRLMAGDPVDFQNRAHFFAHAARLMRQVLTDFSRAQQSEKRGGRKAHVDLSQIDSPSRAAPVDFLDLNVALEELVRLDARQARVVELRYFGGLKNTEVAAVLAISEPTVERDWRAARAWLFGRLQPAESRA